MNCTACKQLLVEYTEDLLDASQKRNIADHLEQCPVCREEAEAIRILQARLIDDSRATGQAHLEDSVMNQILSEQNSKLRTEKTAVFIHDIRSFIMKKSVLRIAAVAVVLIAIFISVNSLQNKVTYAKIIDPVLNARTLTYDVISPDGFWSFHDTVLERKIRRAVPLMKMEMILDMGNSRVMGLDLTHKNAFYSNVEQGFVDWQRDLLHLIRGVVSEAANAPQSAVNDLGRQTIEGHDVVGFKFNPGTDETKIIIWADPNTALPLQIEISMGKSYSKTLAGQNFILKNIEFDVPVDASLVSMELPSGYMLKDSQAFSLELYEEDFLKMLQMWIKYSADAVFPDKLKNVEPLQLAALRKSSGSPDQSPEEQDETWSLYMRGMGFLGALGDNEADYLYSGKGVQYGETDREIFRYRLPESQSWRVVYADLHIETVPAGKPAR
jgi:hypothetical protein